MFEEQNRVNVQETTCGFLVKHCYCFSYTILHNTNGSKHCPCYQFLVKRTKVVGNVCALLFDLDLKCYTLMFQTVTK